ncbi:hypothetical protein [Streptantibioticus silvisoli]|uniref:Uncharacterized protein n=1 Tax=Streptantibioticus silvisoli TaxID=2705255 RepID=A0ABT6W9B5_9ACTN|nr:hypothetical protein [Streptantibioticus silvisoli]MDI5967350.1 hypothetical protein [Streptantibioticus silvisoli]
MKTPLVKTPLRTPLVLNVAVLAGVLALALTGCGGTGGGGGSPAAGPIGADEAVAGMHAVLDKTFDGIRPALTRVLNGPSATPNQDAAGRSDGTAALSEYCDVTTIVAPGRRAELFARVEQVWKALGWSVDTSGTQAGEMPTLDATTPAGYGVELEVGAPGNVYLQVSSPPIRYPEGSTAYSGGGRGDTRPTVESEHWSH